MNIGSIKNVWLRRAALVAYFPLFMVVMTFLGVCNALAEAAFGARDGWVEITADSWGVIVRCWRN